MSKPKPIQAATATEYVIRDGKNGVFSSADKGVCSAKLSALRLAATEQATDRIYTMHKREIAYKDSDKVQGDVTESEIS